MSKHTPIQLVTAAGIRTKCTYTQPAMALADMSICTHTQQLLHLDYKQNVLIHNQPWRWLTC